ncbi:MAG: NrsF family protein [Rhodospirillales bacterium]
MATTTTNELIERLSAGLTPVRRGAAARRLAVGIAGGAAGAGVLMLAWLGVRPDLGAAVGSAPYWMKFAYTLALAGAGVWAVARLSRPAGQAAAAWRVAGVVVAALAVVAAGQLATAPAAAAPRLVMGASSALCPWFIVAIGMPVLAGMLWAMRGLAPTRPMLAGAAAGLAAGALGAWFYAFHCDESAAPFIVVWYTAGILAVAAVGAIAGRFVLRW